MESGLRPAVTQLENRKRRFGARQLSLPRGNQANEAVGAPSTIGNMLEAALGYTGRTEETVLLTFPRKARRSGHSGRTGGGKSERRARQAAAHRLHGRTKSRQWGRRVYGGVEEQEPVG